MVDTSVKKVESAQSPEGEMGQKYLVSGKALYLSHYTNERSYYLRKIRDRIEEAWQQWELSQLDVEALQKLDVKQALIEQAKSDSLEQGYYISKFLVSPLEFGYYSSEQKVRNTIAQMREKNMAFYLQNIYLLAGVLFQKQRQAPYDLSNELFQSMTSV